MEKYDYSALCDCGEEYYTRTLAEMKKETKKHFKECRVIQAIVYVDRHFKGGDIDDSFKGLKIIKS